MAQKRSRTLHAQSLFLQKKKNEWNVKRATRASKTKTLFLSLTSHLNSERKKRIFLQIKRVSQRAANASCLQRRQTSDALVPTAGVALEPLRREGIGGDESSQSSSSSPSKSAVGGGDGRNNIGSRRRRRRQRPSKNLLLRLRDLRRLPSSTRSPHAPALQPLPSRRRRRPLGHRRLGERRPRRGRPRVAAAARQRAHARGLSLAVAPAQGPADAGEIRVRRALGDFFGSGGREAAEGLGDGRGAGGRQVDFLEKEKKEQRFNFFFVVFFVVGGRRGRAAEVAREAGPGRRHRGVDPGALWEVKKERKEGTTKRNAREIRE